MKERNHWLWIVVLTPIMVAVILFILAASIDALMFEMYGSCDPCIVMEGMWDRE